MPSPLEPRRRAERALLRGVLTRRVGNLRVALGISNLSRSEVSRTHAEVDAFRTRTLDSAGYTYVSLDALYHMVREAAGWLAWRRSSGWTSARAARAACSASR